MKRVAFATCLTALLASLLTITFPSTRAKGQFVLRAALSQENLELNDQQRQQRRPGHLLVRFNANASPSEVASLKANRAVSENAALRITHLKVSPEEELAVFDQLKRNSAVEFVELGSLVTTLYCRTDTEYATTY